MPNGINSACKNVVTIKLPMAEKHTFCYSYFKVQQCFIGLFFTYHHNLGTVSVRENIEIGIISDFLSRKGSLMVKYTMVNQGSFQDKVRKFV